MYGLDSDYITSYMLKNALFYELDPISSFSLVASTIMVYNPVSKCLASTKETFDIKIADTGSSFIQGLTWTGEMGLICRWSACLLQTLGDISTCIKGGRFTKEIQGNTRVTYIRYFADTLHSSSCSTDD